MSSIGQSILMALTVTVNKYASSNVQAVHRSERKRPTSTSTNTNPTSTDIARRGLLLSTVLAATQITDSRTELLQSIPYSLFSFHCAFFFGYFLGSLHSLSFSVYSLHYLAVDNLIRVFEEVRRKQGQKWQGGKCFPVQISFPGTQV